MNEIPEPRVDPLLISDELPAETRFRHIGIVIICLIGIVGIVLLIIACITSIPKL